MFKKLIYYSNLMYRLVICIKASYVADSIHGTIDPTVGGTGARGGKYDLDRLVWSNLAFASSSQKR